MFRWQRIVKGNQSLGIVLLLGIIAIYGNVYLYSVEANDLVCIVAE
jgi:hypothetical protein